MRTTIDIPDPIYRELKVRAATEGTTVKEIILEGVELRMHGMHAGEPREVQQRAPFPVIRSQSPASLQLGEEGVYEYIPFP
jgi:hypothetical protein